MKARPFLVALAALLILLIALGLGLWKSNPLQKFRKESNQTLSLPTTARFIPKEGSLTFHSLINPNEIPEYFNKIGKLSKKNSTLNYSKQLRDGIFALVGVDYEEDIANWIGNENSLSLLDQNLSNNKLSWLFILTTKDDEASKRFLQKFWQRLGQSGIEVETSKYRGVGIINSKRSSEMESEHPIATAYIDNHFILMSSNAKTIKEALDISQSDRLNQLSNLEIKDYIDKLKNGLAIITASPQAMQNWLGLSASLTSREDLGNYISAIQINHRDIVFNGYMAFHSSIEEVEAMDENSKLFLQKSGGSKNGIAILNSPSFLLNEKNNHPISQLIIPPMKKLLNEKANYPIELITKADNGAFIWAQKSDGWILGTKKGSPSIESIDEELRSNGFTKTSLQSNAKQIQVWSKLMVKKISNIDTLNSEIGIISLQDNEYNWWAKSLSAINEIKPAEKGSGQEKQLNKFIEKDIPSSFNKISLGSDLAQKQLNRWEPWKLLKTLAGPSLIKVVKELNLAIGSEPIDNIGQSALHIRASLNLG